MPADTELKFIIYRHQSPSGKNYIGVTSQTPEGRWQNGNGYTSQVFHNAIAKYGWEAFTHYLWTTEGWAEYPLHRGLAPYICSMNEACELERKFIAEFDSMKNGYNCSPGGEKLTHSVKMRTDSGDDWHTPPLRSQTCNHCSHQYEKSDIQRYGIFTTCRCGITGRKGSVNRGLYCLQFNNRIHESFTEEYNGFKVRSKQIEDYRTKRQWLDAGYAIKADAVGTEMYAVLSAAENNGKRYIYYLPNEVEPLQ